MKFNLTFTMRQVENGFVININAAGATKQFIAPDFKTAKKTLADFLDAMEAPPATDKPKLTQAGK